MFKLIPNVIVRITISIIEIIPSDIEGNDLKEILDFDNNIIRQRVFKGHKDTIDKIKPIMDITRLIDKDELENKKSEKRFINKVNNIITKMKDK